MMIEILIYCTIAVGGFLIFKYVRRIFSNQSSETIKVDGVEYKEYDDC